ncbi:MAG: glycoside hydrolase family 2 protein [candidate division KSB1 bacterium]|nr:glycoside hydrolase family 2 protein [candidate division KSB1 bacterium]MDZ7366646.1 glycoside hydrolase family 2 protein [candidate division KSB1 bacterium]MDZ7404657.1 glycoside hydrolase family 2 protein [candidate division KSB1 bacterium]
MAVKTIDLNGEWKIYSPDGRFSLSGTAPGSLFYDLEKSGYWGEHDVFFRENNHQCLEIANRDFIYEKFCEVPEALFDPRHRIYLEADGLDTIAEIRLNGKIVAQTENMFRRYQFEVREMLQAGTNKVEIFFRNAIAEIARRQEKRPLWNPPHTLDGAVHLRKNHCSFGWDWGPKIPDLGIWRPIRLCAYAGAKLDEFHVRQNHIEDKVFLDIFASLEKWTADDFSLQVTLVDPDQVACTLPIQDGVTTTILIPQPQLWWPNGYGRQPLYTISCEVKQNDRTIDRKSLQLGLRTLQLERKKDEHGESFQFNINGIPIFARGANYVPEDVYLTRPSCQTTERLIRDAAAANFNCLRIWGGGVYPSDDFYDLCDRYGLIIWQDLMFACGVYDVNNPVFYENIRQEVQDNLKRLRHHPCLGLICGNNEMEWGFAEWDFPKTAEMRAEYLKQYETLFPALVQEICPYVDYWPASPSSGGNFEQPNAEESGDVHFWEVWHNNKPFTEYRKHYFRFLSEFGFESFPSRKTVKAFTAAKDRYIFSPAMEDHQRCEGGNGKILAYLVQYFRHPKDFDSLLYVSQLSQAEAIRVAVEHLRRHRGRCMGATYWQFNDVWPAVSWSSIDYFGRWKALHYAARRMYDQILLSCDERENTASLHLSNEHNFSIGGRVTWRLLSFTGDVIKQGEMQAQVPARTSIKLTDLDLSAELQNNGKHGRYLSFVFTDSRDQTSRYGTAVFAPYKHLHLQNPHLQIAVTEKNDVHEIRVTASSFAKFVALDLEEDDVIFSDNYFDLDAGQTRAVTVPKRELSLNELRRQLTVWSLFDSF